MAEIQKNWIISWINEFSSIKIFIKEMYPEWKQKGTISLWARCLCEGGQGGKAGVNLGQPHSN